jgi:hypothetical protein
MGMTATTRGVWVLRPNVACFMCSWRTVCKSGLHNSNHILNALRMLVYLKECSVKYQGNRKPLCNENDCILIYCMAKWVCMDHLCPCYSSVSLCKCTRSSLSQISMFLFSLPSVRSSLCEGVWLTLSYYGEKFYPCIGPNSQTQPSQWATRLITWENSAKEQHLKQIKPWQFSWGS